MKSVIIALLMTASVSSQAATKVLTPKEFIKSVNNYLANSNNDENQFIGDLDEIGGQCIVALEKDEKGRMNIVLKSDKGFQIDTVIFNDDKIKFTAEESEDGSYSHVYSYGIGGVNKFTVVNADDAYVTMSLRTGSTSLQCGVYF